MTKEAIFEKISQGVVEREQQRHHRQRQHQPVEKY